MLSFCPRRIFVLQVRRFHVWTVGVGVHGALGHGDLEECRQARRVTALPASVTSVAAGWGHTAALTDDGRLFVVGRAYDLGNTLRMGRLWEQSPWAARLANRLGAYGSVDYPEPSEIDVGEPVAQVACSAALTAIVTVSGRVRCFGANRFGQCGVPAQEFPTVYEPSPVRGLEDASVEQVAPGFQHVVALTSSGKVFTWGKNARGQLGRPTEEPVANDDDGAGVGAASVQLPLRATAVGAGFNHTAALTEDGVVWTWGKFQSTRLDAEDPTRLADAAAPRRVVFPESVKKEDSTIARIWCGQHHTVAVAHSGAVWQWGMLPPDNARVSPELQGDDGGGLRRSAERMRHTPARVPVPLGNREWEREWDISAGFERSVLNRGCHSDEPPLEWDWGLQPTTLAVEPEDSGEMWNGGRPVFAALGWRHAAILVAPGLSPETNS